MHAARRLTVGIPLAPAKSARRIGLAKRSKTALQGILTAAVVASGAGIITSGQQPPAQQPPAQQPAAQQPATEQPPAQPTFRVGATFVRVDAFVTKNGEPVGDLKQEEVEIREDNVPQTIRSFEYVNIPPANLQAGVRRDPNTVAESREAVSDPRKRVFVLFLDTYHITQGASMSSRPALMNFLLRTIGPDDLVAGITPRMSPADISFATRTDALESLLNSVYGKRDSIIDDPEEQQIEHCFTRQEWPQFRDRRRAKLSIDAMETLVRHLDGLREERKAIITVTEGWPMFRDDLESMTGRSSNGRVPTGPGIIIGPGGRPGTSDPANAIGGSPSRGECDGIRMQIAAMEVVQQFRDLPDIANRANASFYTIDPRGLAAFDAPIGPTAPPPVAVDQAILRNKLMNLRELAERTDGLAVQNTNDLTGALNRIGRDLSSYYLIGYDSTNPKLDGTYRAIKMTVKRPGVNVRARRGYRAPIDGRDRGGLSGPTARRGGTGGAGSAGGVGPTSDSGGAAAGSAGTGGAGGAVGAGNELGTQIASAVAALASTRADLPIRLRATAVILPEIRELRVLAEVESKVAAQAVWQQGGIARITVRNLEGGTVATAEQPLPLGERTLAAVVPLPATVGAGEYRVLVRITAASKVDSVGDSVAVTVPAKPVTIGDPLVLRRGPSTGVKYVPTADLRFRRQERVRLEALIVVPLDRVKATLVSQAGQPMPLPVQVTERVEGASRIAVIDVSLAPLAAGGYAIMVTDSDTTTSTRVLVPLQVIP
jgi:VWFA-related protein